MDKKDIEYTIIVSDPFGFEGDNGKHYIFGEIIEKIDKYSVVFKSYNKQYFKDENLRGDVFLLKPRYKSDWYSKEDFENIEKENFFLNVNGSLILVEFEFGKDKTYWENNSKFVFIGGIWKGYPEEYINKFK